MATALAADNWAAVASPPSPHGSVEQGTPVPATVVMVPEESTTRTRRSPESAMYSEPSRPTANPLGSPSSAAAAGPASPHDEVAVAHRSPEVPATIDAAPS